MLNDSTRLGLGRLQLLPEIDAVRSHCREGFPLHTLFQKSGATIPVPLRFEPRFSIALRLSSR
jgi:hypothetical protein